MKKFLLHTCCAPCGIAIIDELRQKYNLTVLFYNPNIFPEAEYLKRKGEVVKVCTEWGVPMIDHDYEPSRWDKEVQGLEKEKEGGMRCSACFKMRLYRAGEIAKENGFEVFGTTLTMGSRKPASVINPIGEAVVQHFGLEYMGEDWKKGGRTEKGRQMVAERGIYRQNYCGCRYSLEARREE